MPFNKIVIVDDTGLGSRAIRELEQFAVGGVIKYDDIPKTESEIIKRVDDSECALVSWNTRISEDVLKKCPGLKYVGMCCSLYDEASANVDIKFARENNIVVKGVRDYGDEGLVEYILAELIRLVKGIGPHQWKEGRLN
ncbi:Rossmann-fold NAD(P)-binding domain-containing protein [Mucilaginibacter gilvus]|uniref:hypothetical protein n=1 Tax=Mucilaginibacter gilvus TaxID=2305909 RepID=UPI001ABABBED|nr:hypothetical protein [Mucilaginibacter gilvus]